MQYIDCNEQSWEVELTIHGEPVRYSARTAAIVIEKEEAAYERHNYSLAEKMRAERQQAI